MPNQLQITTAQRQSSDRHNLREAVYLLSGEVTTRSGVPNASIRWSTREVTAFGEIYEAYMAPPRAVVRAMGFEPGSQGQFPAIRIPIRNLPFGHTESIVASVTDDDYRFENTVVTLRVGYVRPGEDPNDLDDADWTPLVLKGFLGPPEDVTLDGFVLPVFNRGARRNLSLQWPQLPSPGAMAGGAIDRKDGGRMPPVIVGVPQEWIRVPTLNLGVRGFLASGYDAGSTQLTFSTITAGPEDFVSGNVPDSGNQADLGKYGTGTGRAGLLVHYLGPVYEVVSASYDQAAQEFTVTLDSGLAAAVPRGGFVQQWGPSFNPATGRILAASDSGNSNGEVGWWWVAAGHAMNSDVGVRYGWRFADGEVRPIDEAVWPLAYGSNPTGVSLDAEGGRNVGGLSDSAFLNATKIFVSRGTRAAPNAPVYYDPLVDSVEITQQPEFTTEAANTGAINRATGGSGTDNDKLRDGSEETGRAFAAGEEVTLTFPDAPSPFSNSDTTKSTLHIVMSTSSSNGIRFTSAGGGTEFAQITPPVTGVQKFAIAQSSARNFNTSVRVVAPTGGGGSVFEVWWEHDLSATVQNSRTQDVAITSGANLVGPPMQFAELVVRHTQQGSVLHQSAISGGNVINIPSSSPFYDQETFSGATYRVPYPTNALLGLHLLLGTEGDVDLIDTDSYEAAHTLFAAENIRLSFAWTEETRPNSWSELERQLGEQSRSFCFYGPSGHQVLFLEAASGLEVATIQQSFRLPGCPGANTFPSTGPLMERTRVTELINQVEAEWDRDLLTDKFRRITSGANDTSISEVGARRSDRGPYQFSMHSPWEGNSNWDVAGQVSGIVQFYADRQAFAATRFTFDTAWIAHGLDRGSIIRVAYPVTPQYFRNVVCEVESVAASPLSNESFQVIARAVSTPLKSLEPNCTWVDAFDDETDQWPTVIASEYDTWKQHWTNNCPDEVIDDGIDYAAFQASGATLPATGGSDDTLSCTLPRPENVTGAGFLMLACVVVNTDFNLNTLTPPAGWAEIASEPDGAITTYVFEKTSGGSEADDYTWTGVGSAGFSTMTGVIIAFDNKAATVNDALTNTSDSFLTIPAVTVSQTGSALLAFIGAEVDTNAENFSVSSEMELAVQHVADSSGESPGGSALAVEKNVAAGSISGRTFSHPEASNFFRDKAVIALVVEF